MFTDHEKFRFGNVVVVPPKKKKTGKTIPSKNRKTNENKNNTNVNTLCISFNL